MSIMTDTDFMITGTEDTFYNSYFLRMCKVAMFTFNVKQWNDLRLCLSKILGYKIDIIASTSQLKTKYQGAAVYNPGKDMIYFMASIGIPTKLSLMALNGSIPLPNITQTLRTIASVFQSQCRMVFDVT
jgi:hypothetical protein